MTPLVLLGGTPLSLVGPVSSTRLTASLPAGAVGSNALLIVYAGSRKYFDTMSVGGPPLGATGEKGDRGPTGFAGPAGETGDAGPRGATGPAGPEGPEGVSPQGVMGPQGPEGQPGTLRPCFPNCQE